MKNFIAPILLFAFALPALLNVAILVKFKFNQDYIAKELCVKKDEPSNSCNGKCHLAKELVKNELPDQQQAPEKLMLLREITLFLKSDKTSLLSRFYVPKVKRSGPAQTYYTSPALGAVFKPPKGYL